MTTLRTEPSALHRSSDQASRLRALVQAAEPRGGHAPGPALRTVPVIAITSGKGGVGKTSLCVNLCIAFAKLGLRPTLLDADLGMANADVMCGLSPAHRLERVIGLAGPASSSPDRARVALTDIAVEAPGGFRLIPGAVGIARMAGLDDAERALIIDALAELDRDSDVVLIDTGAGVSPGVMTFVRAADVAVIVATPEPTSITDAYAMIKCLLRGPDASPNLPEIGLVVNQAADALEAGAVHARISAVARKFLGTAPAMFGWVPSDRAMPQAVRARRPLLLSEPRSVAARSVIELARGLVPRLHLRSTPLAGSRAGLLGALGAVSAWFSRSGRSVRADCADRTV